MTRIALTGAGTSLGVESTDREQGYRVTTATGAMTETDADAHHHSYREDLPRLAETGTTAEILNLPSTTRS
ncbi:isochorismatase [Streptomyces sp. NPDC057543]|uniref:isochorismatase n=1 Tax=Streptomyces sp. NPDC057543 TaxID=3346163 RepID=UPI0036B2B3BA